jgi:DNA recombination protein RmuC
MRQNEKINATLSDSVEKLQQSNERKLDQMRETVDEKLTSTLTKRLDSSFKLVGEQLENVHKSLGEMKELAGGVNDLQRVLTNVKARGTWAEVQLGNILEQTLTQDQYACNVSTKGDNNRVEFAVKIPSKQDDDSFIWLPIDSKFPQEDYLRLVEAAEKADKDGVEVAGKALERRIKEEAKTISNLYINVPHTTDFAILFLATEGLYAEVLRRPGLSEELQTKYKIMVCGPTTITAFLNTLRMGFRTIALDKRAADVWKVLGAAKSQYATFEGVLAKAKKKIDEAGSTLEEASHRNSIIQKNLRSVESLEPSEAEAVLGLTDGQ